jgi:hypothetical protein
MDIWLVKTTLNPLPAQGKPYAVLPTFRLSAYPNPFNPSTTLTFTLPKAARTKLRIYDVAGRVVQSLDAKLFNAGVNQLSFDGSGLPSGVYFARLDAGEFSATQKMLLLK